MLVEIIIGPYSLMLAQPTVCWSYTVFCFKKLCSNQQSLCCWFNGGLMSSEYLLVLLKQQPEYLRIHVLSENKCLFMNRQI